AVDDDVESPVADIHEREEFVDREEIPGAVAELSCDIAAVIRKRLGGVARLPAALVLQRLRQVPVIERGEGFDGGFEQCIDQAAIEVEALGGPPAGAG